MLRKTRNAMFVINHHPIVHWRNWSRSNMAPRLRQHGQPLFLYYPFINTFITINMFTFAC